MSIDIDDDSEELMPLAKAAKLLPIVRGNKPIHPSTLARWATIGIKAASGRRVKLVTTFVGGTRMVSMAALKRFFEQRNDVEYKPLPESAEREKKYLEEQAAESIRRMRAEGLIKP
jgi:hypothetical protein